MSKTPTWQRARLYLELIFVVALGALPVIASAHIGAAPDQGSPWHRYKLTNATLNDVAASGPDDAWAVGSDGLFAHWNGSDWSAVDNTKLVGVSTVYAIDMLPTGQAWASSTQGRVLAYNGTAWSLSPGNLTADMRDISMLNATEGWAVGSASTFGHYNGTSWQQVVPGGTLTTTMYGIKMVSPTDGWAVGGASDASGTVTKIARYNGTSWQPFPAPVINRIFYDVDMLDATYGWAVGQSGALMQWDGANWTTFTGPSGAAYLDTVKVVSRTDAWAAGSTNISNANLWHWNGTSWSEVPTPNEAPLHGLHMMSATGGWAVGDRGTIHRYNGSTWTVSNTHWTTYGFYGLDFINPNDGWAVGVLNADPPAYGLVHWNGADWIPYQPPAFQPTMYDVDMVASDAVWAVGTSGYIFKWNGTAWSRDTSPADAHLYAMSMVSATDGWAVGGSGRIVHYDGTAWTNFTSGTTTNLWSIDMASANEGWAGGTLGLMLHYQNGTWTPISPNPASFTIEGLDMLNENEGWAVGYSGTILHYTNGTWTPQTSPTSNNLLNVHMLSVNEGWAVGAASAGAPSVILHYLNGTWSLVPSPTGVDLRDIYMFDANHGWAVGQAPGPILRYDEGVTTPTPTGTTVTPTPTSTAHAPTFTATTQPVRSATATSTATIEPTGSATAIATTTSTPQASTTPCSITFSDVHSTDYFYTAVQYLACHGAISGYADGSFRPYNDTTRGQLTKIVVAAEGFPIDTTGGPHFTDVLTTNPFYVFIETAYNRGLVSGYADGTFRWGNNITRAQLSKVIVQAQGWTIDTTGGPHFTDVPTTNPFYSFVETAYNHGIIAGYSDGTFRPNNNATRGQISVIIYRALTSP